MENREQDKIVNPLQGGEKAPEENVILANLKNGAQLVAGAAAGELVMQGIRGGYSMLSGAAAAGAGTAAAGSAAAAGALDTAGIVLAPVGIMTTMAAIVLKATDEMAKVQAMTSQMAMTRINDEAGATISKAWADYEQQKQKLEKGRTAWGLTRILLTR